MRQQPQKGGTQQGTGRKTHQVRQDVITQGLAQHQKQCRGQHAQQATQQAEDDDPDNQGHSVIPGIDAAHIIPYLHD